MLISIITATYNSESYIRETYHSIKSQTFCDWEWVVTDDCSKDDTYLILEKLAENDPRIRVFRSTENKGAAISRNNSIKNAHGKYIAFIDADDLWLPQKLEVQLAYMKNSAYGITFTAYQIVDEQAKPTNKVVDMKVPDFICYQDLLAKRATFGCSTVMIDHEKIANVEMPDLRTGQDYATWLSILKRGETAALIKQPLTQYRIMENSISRNKLKKAARQWQIYREIEELNFFAAIYYFVQYAWRAVFRK